MKDEFWEEVLHLVNEYDAQRPKLSNEYRLYYNTDNGTLIGCWQNDYPEGTNYIVLSDLEILNKNNTLHLRVQNNKLIVLDPKLPNKKRLVKSAAGFKVVLGYAALILEENENYPQTEYYDRANY